MPDTQHFIAVSSPVLHPGSLEQAILEGLEGTTAELEGTAAELEEVHTGLQDLGVERCTGSTQAWHTHHANASFTQPSPPYPVPTRTRT
jgi:hypothetical protein